MKISSVINNDRLVLSFEVFPPKTSDNLESVKSATGQIAALKPGFMSVTCGAGGNLTAAADLDHLTLCHFAAAGEGGAPLADAFKRNLHARPPLKICHCPSQTRNTVSSPC